jgi:hypothetical protein
MTISPTSLRLSVAARRLRVAYHVLYRGVLSGAIPSHKEPPAKGWWVRVSDLDIISAWAEAAVRPRPVPPERYLIDQVRIISYVQGQTGMSLRMMARVLGMPAETLGSYALGKRPVPEGLLYLIQNCDFKKKENFNEPL